MTEHQISLRTIRIIPWDIGKHLLERTKKVIISKLKKSKWKLRQHSIYCDKNRPIVFYIFYNKNILTLDLFDDGFAIFTIHERVKKFEIAQDFDPVFLNQNKTNIHIDILKGSHEISPLLYQTMEVIWTCIPQKKRRKSASFDWENRGISYVFSFFIIQTTPTILRQKSFIEKLHACLFPIPVLEIISDFKMDQTGTIEDHTLFDHQTNINDCIITNFTFRKIFFSWATAIIAGQINSKIVLDFCRTMRNLQHAWFVAYIADRHLDHIVKNFSARNNITDLIDLDSQMSRVSKEIGGFTSIHDSMATTVARKTYQIAAKQSGLQGLSDSIKWTQLSRQKITYIKLDCNYSANTE